jgi:nicotinamide-nucleotide amidase
MATGVSRLVGADLAVSATGVGGPQEQEGRSVGTVFVAVHGLDAAASQEHHLLGAPAKIVAATVMIALEILAQSVGAG